MKLYDFGFLILMLAIIGGMSLANPRECERSAPGATGQTTEAAQMKIGDVARAALPRSEDGEQLACALEELQQQVNALTDFIATTGEPVTLETAAEDGEVLKFNAEGSGLVTA